MPKSVAVIGGGMIGLCSAYYLSKRGHHVTVFDRGSITDGCSFGNAGMVVPSHFIPLSAPGMISKGVRWMFDPRSPFYIKPRLDRDLFRWGYYFYKHATEKHVERAMYCLRDLNLFSMACFQELEKELPFDFGFQQRGILMLFKSKKVEDEEDKTVCLAGRLGIEAHQLSGVQVQDLEPDVEVTVRGGVYFPGDAHITPNLFIGQLLPLLKRMGVLIHSGDEVEDFVVESGRVTGVRSRRGAFYPDEVILTAGAWSPGVARKLGLRLPIQPGKGYSFAVRGETAGPRIPAILLEARVAVTPMGRELRFGGTMEISGLNHDVDMNRAQGIAESVPRYYPRLKLTVPPKREVWHGLRPCSPDGLPYIGRSRRIGNLVIATGHSMMGISQGPGTGKLVADVVDEGSVSMDLLPFDPERFS